MLTKYKTYSGELFKDGMNAHRIGRDYRKEEIQVNKNSRIKIHLAPGGGFALMLK